MTKYFYFIFLLLPLFTYSQQQNKLWYKTEAKVWTEALPVGNGRLGAMIYGNVGEELIQLNESTLWSGGPVKDNTNPSSPSYLPLIRKAIFEGDYQKASTLSKKMQGAYSQNYLPLGDLRIKQAFNSSSVGHYYRDLNIGTAVATTTFTVNGINYKREIFSSAPDQVIVIHFTASQLKKLSIDLTVKSLLNFKVAAMEKDVLSMSGRAPSQADPSYVNDNKEPIKYGDSNDCNGMRYQLLIKPMVKGGAVETDEKGIHIKNADEITLLLSAATSFNGFDKCPNSDGKNEQAIARSYLTKATVKSYDNLYLDHLKGYQKYFNRVSLSLGSSSNEQLPTDERLAAYAKGDSDPGLEALYFQYGRYLLISSSRPGGTAANLQGIWNKELRPPWSSNYTININAQMNYWPSESTNLSEMHQPFLALIKDISVNGAKTAKSFYGLDGWVAHHNSDIWAMANPVGDFGKGDPKWANWAMGANWLSAHLWEHYKYTGDKDFLRKTAYPLIKGAVVFTMGWLVKDKDGFWVTAPSGSPENEFRDEKGNNGAIALGSTMDMSIIRELFANFLSASTLLDIDPVLRKAVVEKQKMLYPYQIGKKGNIVEWYKDWDETEVHHRHVSHLYGLYPANQISPMATPALTAAARKTLEIRGDDGTGWSLAWKINFWARLLDGNHAHTLLKTLLRLTKENNVNYGGGGGTYPNLFDAHPPFQIDGNFGGTAGMVEMLLQSQNTEIHLLPALPDAWRSGKVTGLKARGGYEVDMTWGNKILQTATIIANNNSTCNIRSANRLFFNGKPLPATQTAIGFVTKLTVVKGKKYLLKGKA
jgi:alpha-L-fucosidase 2